MLMRKILMLLLLCGVCFLAGAIFGTFIIKSNKTKKDGVLENYPKEKPLEKYSIENLSNTKIPPGEFIIGDIIESKENFKSYLFTLTFDPSLSNKEKKVVSGQINIPSKEGSFPLIVMLRGYVDRTIYETGIGTKKAAEKFAEAGFITVAPDFLGYGKSSKEAENVFESRFQTYTTTLVLLESLQNITSWNKKDVFIWGHSNGGQIAIITLEITAKNIPTVLWAPVSKPFPYSILYYTDDSEDKGKSLRKFLSEFEKDYDAEKYSLDNYLERINTSLLIHQGEADDAVPKEWTNNLVNQLKRLGKNPVYYTYKDTDHNMRPNWDLVVARDIEFYKKFLYDFN